MTSREALGLLASRVQVGAYKEEMQKCFDIVNEAINKLEKRDTPMKVNSHAGSIFREYKCQCGQRFNSFYHLVEINFCPKCGQRIDWDDDND